MGRRCRESMEKAGRGDHGARVFGQGVQVTVVRGRDVSRACRNDVCATSAGVALKRRSTACGWFVRLE